MKTIRLLGLLAATLVPVAASAATRTATLAIPGMDDCAVCPITIRTALQRVPGVETIAVHLAHKEVTVAYDDTRTSPAILAKASSDVGYPATVNTVVPPRPGR